MTVIPLHVTRAAKERGVASLAWIRGMAAGLSPIQCNVLVRYARDQFRKGDSPARAVAKSSTLAHSMKKETAT